MSMGNEGTEKLVIVISDQVHQQSVGTNLEIQKF